MFRGCDSTEKVKLLNYNGNITKKYKVGDKLNCELLNDDNEFKVKFNNNLSKCHINRVSLRDSLFLM